MFLDYRPAFAGLPGGLAGGDDGGVFAAIFSFFARQKPVRDRGFSATTSGASSAAFQTWSS